MPFVATTLLPLCQLPNGAIGRIRELTGNLEFCQRIRELGFVETALVRKIAEQSGQCVGWHYHEDDVRMVVKCLGDRAGVEAVILTLLPEHNALFRAAQAKQGIYYN